MSGHKELKDFQEQIAQCVKCGCCRAHCPVFGEQRRESGVARGKVALAQALLDGEVDLDKRLMQDMSRCLLCGSCTQKCPNLVPTDEIVMAARRTITGRKGVSPLGRAISSALKRPAAIRVLGKAGARLSGLLFKKVPGNSGLRLRFPAPYLAKDRTLPQMAATSFLERHPEFIPGEPGRPTVAFFVGCSINYAYPQIGEATLKVLRFLGLNILLPKSQSCCGLPALSSGDGETARLLADRNLAAFGNLQPEFILTSCASCTHALAKYYRGLSEQHDAFAAKVMDVHRYIVQAGLPEKLSALPAPGPEKRVTYHDPCHLRGLGITKEPRAILRSLRGVEFLEMEGADRCCGLGGTFSAYHYGMSKGIGAKKAASIRESCADLVATACPGCMMQLQDSINHAGLPTGVVHLMELIAERLPCS